MNFPFWRRKRREDDFKKEIESHLEMANRDRLEQGDPPETAHHAVHREFGNVDLVRELTRQQWRWNWVDALLRDTGYGVRMLRKNLGFTAVAVLTLALGIGATTAIFSALNPILFEPLPYPHASRIMMIWDIFQGKRSDVTFHTYRELAARGRIFDSIAVLEPWQPTMTGADQPERFNGQSVSSGYFQVLGVSPVMGRDFQAADDVLKGPKVVILSDTLWRRRFARDRTIIGRQIILDGDVYAVIGVMPHAFENVLGPSAEIWSPMQYDTQHITAFDTAEWGHHLHMVGRLRPGLGIDQARRDLELIAHNPVPEFPRPRWASLKDGFIANSLQDEITRGVKPALFTIFGAVILVLLIACVNVTNLLLARGVERRGEFAMRAALGAGDSRLIRQLLTESLLLAAMGGVAGMAVAMLSVRALVALSPSELPRVAAISINGTVFAFGLGITTLIGLAFGLIPALHAARSDPHRDFQQISRHIAGGHRRVRGTLVVAEVALALVLLVSTGLLLRSLQRLLAVPVGFDSSHLLTMQVQTSGHRFDDDGAKHRFFAQALEAVRNVPGVAAAAFTNLLPLSGDQYGVYGTQFENGVSYSVFRYVVTPGYFEAMGIALHRGRLLDAHDGANSPPAVVISESLAKSQFPGHDPIGQRVHIGPLNRPWYSIVGVVDDVKQASVAESDPDAVYITPNQSWFADDAMSLVVRTRGDAAALTPVIREAIWSVDKDQPIVHVTTMDDLLAASSAERRFALILFEAFALAALVLAAAGIYGVLSGSVAERTHEMGIRQALGAGRGDVLRLVLAQATRMTLVGVGIGTAGALEVTPLLASLLFKVSATDPVTFVAVAALLTLLALAASFLPAWRAMRVDPVVALRYE
ncbi:MAG: ABC transporter permease [Acidobacteriia bacterium]|nr:ABC transporter permease [Terriglobia bacterium]